MRIPDGAPGQTPAASGKKCPLRPDRTQALAILIFLSLFFGLLIGLSPLMTSLNYSDSLLPVHLSLDQPGRFYWGQARFGMLVPMLAHGVQDPWANLFTQQVISAGFGVFGVLALGLLLGRSLETSLSAGLLSLALLFVSQSPHSIQTLFMIAQPHGLSIGLFVLLMLLVRDHTCLLDFPWKTAGAKRKFEWVLLFFAAAYLFLQVFWVNLSFAPYAVVLILLGWPRAGARGGLILFFFVLAGVWYAVFIDRQDTQHFLPAEQWFGAMGRHLQNCIREYFLFRPGWVLLFAALAGAAVLAGCLRGGKRWAKRSAPFLLLALCSLVLSVLFSLNRWVTINLSDARYSATSLILLVSSLSLAAVCSMELPSVFQLKIFRQKIPALLMIAAAIATAAGLWTFGFPNPREARRLLIRAAETSWGFGLKDLDARDPRFITGNYWFAWPAGFLINAERARQGRRERVVVLSARSYAILDLVENAVQKTSGPLLVSGKADDPDFLRYLDQVFLRSVKTTGFENGVRTDELRSTR
ncbi:MAG: hypothetical protein NTV93_00495 [Verrucomicrobia bacterium]|nr:hypothetical protein [Verrucomicrobiota bacterium]